MRSYPHINPRLSSSAFWSWASAVSLFSHEETLLDNLCSAITSYQLGTRGAQACQAYWDGVLRADPLFPYAQTQLTMLRNSKPTDRLENGGFEAGDLAGW